MDRNDDVMAAIRAADQAAQQRYDQAHAAYLRALRQFENSGADADAAAELRRARAEAIDAGNAYFHEGRHVAGRHHDAMRRWQRQMAQQLAGEMAGREAG